MSLMNWIWRQLNARDALDGMAVVIGAAVEDLGAKRVAQELRRLADYLERTGSTAAARASTASVTFRDAVTPRARSGKRAPEGSDV
jgi:hypothetical protein